MYRETEKRKNEKYETKPNGRVKALVVSMTATLYAAIDGFPTNPFRPDSSPTNSRSAIRPAPTDPSRRKPVL